MALSESQDLQILQSVGFLRAGLEALRAGSGASSRRPVKEGR